MASSRIIWCDRGWMPVYYGFCPSERAWKQEMERLDIKPPEPYPNVDARATTFETKDKTVVIVTVHERIDRRNDRLGIIGLIVHEATHVWQAIRRNIGEDEPSAEFEAYAMQAISSQLLLAFSKTRKRLG